MSKARRFLGRDHEWKMFTVASWDWRFSNKSGCGGFLKNRRDNCARDDPANGAAGSVCGLRFSMKAASPRPIRGGATSKPVVGCRLSASVAKPRACSRLPVTASPCAGTTSRGRRPRRPSCRAPSDSRSATTVRAYVRSSCRRSCRPASAAGTGRRRSRRP